MKAKKLYFIGLFFFGFLAANNLEAQTPFTKGSGVIHAGLGLVPYGGYYNNFPLAFLGSYDHGIVDDLGIGNLGIGGMFGITPDNNTFLGDDYNFTRISILARGTYHFHFVGSEVFDFYAGVVAGARFYVSDNGYTGNDYFPLDAGPFAGINYWFSPSFGVWSEVGYGVAWLRGGLSFGFGGK
jgi:hypothetical protein